MNLPFRAMPDDARLWVFASPRALEPSESERLLAGVDGFLERWRAHGAPVAGARDWRAERFLLVAADEEATGVSGCSIDALTDALRALEGEIGTTLLDSATHVWFRDETGEVRAVSRSEFRDLARRGRVGPETPVYDNTAPTVGAVRAGRWERPAREAWQGRLAGF